MSDKPKVLVADDSATIRFLLKKYLSDKYDVSLAQDGREVLEKYKKSPPDAFILDLQMPVIDGFAVCEAIKKDSSIPVIILTSMAAESDQKWAENQGADIYLTKPVDKKEVKAALDKLI